MRHRGPDAEAVVACGADAILEHCRLAIIDPVNAQADQPFTDPSGRWTIVYNGEVFNHAEIRADLEARGMTFRTRSDTEVVLQGFIMEGESILHRLRGMFAFIVWDRDQRQLFAARDQLGVKPLYWALVDEVFVAASEMRTMLGHPRIRSKLDPASVVEYLAFGRTPCDRTLIRDIRKLPPGHALRLSDGEIQTFEYWDLLPPTATGDADLVKPKVIEMMNEAVAASLVADVPVGLMLSGGLDSSTIAVLAARHKNASDMRAYSVAFGGVDDEAHAAARLASDLGLRHTSVVLDERTLEENFDEWLWGIDEPSSNPTWLAVWFIARAARRDGIKVLLSGDGGDELFGGYNRWMTYLRFRDRIWVKVPDGIKRAAGKPARRFLPGLAGDVAARAAGGRELFVGSRPFHDDDLARCLAPRGKAAIEARHPEDSVAPLRHRFGDRFPEGDYLAWMSYLSLKTHLVEDFLGRLDKMGMRESVEGRVPLLDPVLARWAIGVPQHSKVPGYRQKSLFRDAVMPHIPRYILERPKQGFCPPVTDWATRLLSTRLTGVDALADHGIVTAGTVDYLHQNRSTTASFALWTLGTLGAWCEQNL